MALPQVVNNADLVLESTALAPDDLRQARLLLFAPRVREFPGCRCAV
jgi:hypothetical protein